MDFLARHEGHKEVKTDRYWALGYYFETLDKQQKHHRRELLEWYGFIAQWSVLVIFVAFQLSFFFGWSMQSVLQYEQPKSPSFTKGSQGRLGWLKKIHGTFTKARWWLSRDVVRGWNWGTRGEWFGATGWTVWLLYLCIARTGNGKQMNRIKSFDNADIGRLPASNEAFWTHRGIAIAHPLPPRYESALLSGPMAHTMLPRAAEGLPPDPRPDHVLAVLVTCNLLLELFHFI
jgi:hypothetical protein